jgi:hypothetical protein
MRLERLSILGLALAGLYIAACGVDNATSPSSVERGATLKGTVRNGSVAASGASASSVVHAMSTGSGITIAVMETGVSTTTDASGQFVLKSLPGGVITLHFKGKGIDAILTLSGLVDGQTLTITVTVSGSHAELDDDPEPESSPSPKASPTPGPSPSPRDFCFVAGAKAEVEGNIAAEDTSSITVTQHGKGDFLCQVAPSTRIRHGNTSLTLADLKVGSHVHVSGTGLGSLDGVCQVSVAEIKLQ